MENGFWFLLFPLPFYFRPGLITLPFFPYFDNNTEWEDKEEGKEVTQQWEDDWDDDDVNDDFSLQLRRELENNSEKS